MKSSHRDNAAPLAEPTRWTPSVRWAITSLALSMLLASLGTSIANVTLPTLAEAFGAEFQTVQWVVLAYLLAITASIVSIGNLGDVVDRRRLLQAGLVIFTVASAVSGLASTIWIVIAARAAQGIGAACMVALATAFVAELIPNAQTGRAMGLVGTSSAIGTALGPSLGGALIHGLGWRAVFLINVPLGLATALLVQRHLPSGPSRPSIAPSGSRGGFSRTLTLLRDPTMSASFTASLLVSMVLMATLVVGPFYLSITHGLNAGRVGMVMSMGPLVATLTGIPAGHLVDRFGTRRMAFIGLGGITLGAFALSVTPEALGVLAYGSAVVAVTASYALFQASNSTSLMRAARPTQRGVVSGLLNLSRNLGLLIGASLMGAVFAHATSSAGGTELASASASAIAHGARVTFGLATLLPVLAAAALALMTSSSVPSPAAGARRSW